MIFRGTFAGLAAQALTITLLASTSALAQNTPTVDRLIQGSAFNTPSRTIDPTTRAAKRYAIVIGNADYTGIPDLENARADASVVAQFLSSQGYEVHHHEDITKRGFEDVLRRVLFDVDKDTEVVVFFAGHGFQIGSENYLVPVDADLDSIYDVPFEAVSLGSLVGIIGARARLQIVILDSCRDNPFAGKEVLTQIGNELRETRTGFASQAAPLNSMLIYSTSPGSVAFDGEGDNSPFTSALIAEASQNPDALVKDVFEDVRRVVYQITDGRQIPWDSSTLIEPASFGLGSALSKPVAVNGAGASESRGLALISKTIGLAAPAETTPTQATPAQQVAQPVSTAVALVEAEFVPEVDIGLALKGALNLGASDVVTIIEGPKSGRLVLSDIGGMERNVVGETLTSNQINQLLLVNQSVQIPAVSMPTGRINEQITVSVNGEAKTVAVSLAPNQCDFHAGAQLDPGGMGITRFANEMEPQIALQACQAAIAKEPNVARYHYQLGRALIALKRNDEAHAAFERARDLGHARAWVALGTSLFNQESETGGKNTGIASDEVLGLYARGVEAGDPAAFYALGRQLLRFGGSPESEIEGYDLMMRSLEVGYTFAMNELGYFYLDADGEFHDPERGLRYLRESAARNDIYGYNNMGLVYLEGLGGTPVDYAAAFDMFTKAAEGGHPNGPANLGWMYLEGQAPGGVNNVKAVEWFAKGLQRGDASAGETAGWLIPEENVPGYDIFDAAVFAAKGAALTNQQASVDARDLLTLFPAQALGGGAQKLIVELGGDVTVDGAFGPGSQAAMDEVLARLNAGPAERDPVDRIIQLAALVWSNSSFRVDLY